MVRGSKTSILENSIRIIYKFANENNDMLFLADEELNEDARKTH